MTAEKLVETCLELVTKNGILCKLMEALVNPRVVRACCMMLTDWEKITTRALKSAVTILYRIAVGCKMPTMLFQASLFRIFQKVLNSPKDVHHDELRRLAIYVVRQFVRLAPGNPKIYAELLFLKSQKEAYDIEYNYEDHDMGRGQNAGKNVWTEEDEQELRDLFTLNQEHPESDQDVIEWIVDHLSNKSRTRRGVMKKLREMGMVFKAPTKRSLAEAAVKQKWNKESDDQLRALYDEHRLNAPLKNIMLMMGAEHSRQAVIKRMITIGLIADKSEIVRPRKPKMGGVQPMEGDGGNQSSDDDGRESDESEEDIDFDRIRNGGNGGNRPQTTGPKKKMLPKKQAPKPMRARPAPLDVPKIKYLINEVILRFNDALSWLHESFEDALEDFQESSDDPDDAVPLVPITEHQSDAMENPEFIKLLKALGMHEPIAEMENYWRIPITFTALDLKARSQLLTGLYDESALDINDKLAITDDENENDDDLNGENFMDRMIYTKSDDDEESSFRPDTTKSKNRTKRARKNIDLDDDDGDEGNVAPAAVHENRGKTKIAKNNEFEIDSQELRSRYNQLIDSDDSDYEGGGGGVSNKRKSNTKKLSQLLSDSDESETIETNEMNDKSQSLKKNRQLIVDDDNDDDDNVNQIDQNKSKKRDRSEDDDVDDTGDGYHVAKDTLLSDTNGVDDEGGSAVSMVNNSRKKVRRIISSDEED